MSTSQTLQPMTGSDHLTPDPNVHVPDHVRAAAAAADELHKQAYTPPVDPAAEEAARAAAEAAAAEAAAQNPPDPAQVTPAPATPATPQPGDENVSAEEWRHRFLSMQGRFTAAQRTIGSMEEQMRQLGEELVRTQNMVAGQGPAPHAGQPQTDPTHGNLITDADREAYGDELIDLARRAAREVAGPEIEQLRADNARLTQRVQSTGKRELFQTLDLKLPNWRAINKHPQFINWLRLPNIYTGQVRGTMLRAAVDGAEAPKVLALFNDFLLEANATGLNVPAAQTEHSDPAPAPRTPALDLTTIAAPGKARPASGDSQVPSEKPIYTRAQISKFYDDKRRGFYAGREADATAFEADLGAAQREGRIR